jgi:hypothetical protein
VLSVSRSFESELLPKLLQSVSFFCFAFRFLDFESFFFVVCVNFASRLIALLEEVLFLRGLGQGKLG